MTAIQSTDRPAKGFGQTFGLDPRIACLTLLVDTMLFGGEIASFGALIFFSVLVGIVLGGITYRAQMKWYGDDSESALIKGAIIALLTAIPSSIPAIIYLPGGAVGAMHKLLKK